MEWNWSHSTRLDLCQGRAWGGEGRGHQQLGKGGQEQRKQHAGRDPQGRRSGAAVGACAAQLIPGSRCWRRSAAQAASPPRPPPPPRTPTHPPTHPFHPNPTTTTTHSNTPGRRGHDVDRQRDVNERAPWQLLPLGRRRLHHKLELPSGSALKRRALWLHAQVHSQVAGPGPQLLRVLKLRGARCAAECTGADGRGSANRWAIGLACPGPPPKPAANARRVCVLHWQNRRDGAALLHSPGPCLPTCTSSRRPPLSAGVHSGGPSSAPARPCPFRIVALNMRGMAPAYSACRQKGHM